MTHFFAGVGCSCWDCLQAIRKVVPPLSSAERPTYGVPEEYSTILIPGPDQSQRLGVVMQSTPEPTLDLYVPTWRCPKGHEQPFAVAATYGTAAQHAPATAYCLACFNEWAAERFPTAPVEREKTHG